MKLCDSIFLPHKNFTLYDGDTTSMPQKISAKTNSRAHSLSEKLLKYTKASLKINICGSILLILNN